MAIPIPSIPDNSYKVFFLIAALMGAHMFYSYEKTDQRFNEASIAIDNSVIEYNAEVARLKEIEKKMVKDAERIAAAFSMENPIKTVDSFLVFDQTILG